MVGTIRKETTSQCRLIPIPSAAVPEMMELPLLLILHAVMVVMVLAAVEQCHWFTNQTSLLNSIWMSSKAIQQPLLGAELEKR